MDITVTARHCEVPDDLRARAEELVRKSAKRLQRPQHAEVVFDAEHQRRVVELLLRLPRGRTHVASAEAPDFRSALDQAVEKLRRQFGKGDGRTRRAAGA